MSLAATGALTSAALAAVQTGATESAIVRSSEHQDTNESSFAMAESSPQFKILPVPGGLWKPVDTVEDNVATVPATTNINHTLDEAAIFLVGSNVALLSIFLMGFMLMGAITKAKGLFGNKSGDHNKDAEPSQEFVPFVRRGDEVSPLNPVRIGCEELPGKPADTSASSRIFGRRGIQ